jgi:gluconolactonase
MKRILPLSLLVVSAAWVYVACSDDPIEEPATPILDGDGGGGTDSGGPTGNDGGPGPSDSGTPDAPVVFTGNPIEGAAAAKVLSPGNLGAGFPTFADGPIFRNGKLFFTAPLSFEVYEYSAPGVFTPVRDYNAAAKQYAPIGQTFDPKTNSTVTAESDSTEPPVNRLVRWTADAGAFTDVTLTFDASAGQPPWDSPNDVVARADGTLYVTDPGYQRGMNAALNRIYRITATGSVFEEKSYPLEEKPNGIALSPDGNTLYVSLTDAKKVVKFPVAANGTLGAEAPFATIATTPDGLNVDTAGNVYVATEAGVEVYKPDATKWGVVATPIAATAVAFGGADFKTMYITAQGALYEVTGLKVAGSTQ